MANKLTNNTEISEAVFTADDLERAPLVLSTSACTVYEIYLHYASGSSDAGFKCYDVAGGTAITAGTTFPDLMIYWDGSVWGSSANKRFTFPQGVTFDNGLLILASGQSGRAASGDPTASLVVKILFK